MKLSAATISVLTNFVTINAGIVFNPGKILKTNTQVKTVFGQAAIEEEFPKTFGINDLGKLLGVLSLYKDPELDFEDDSLVIKSGRSRTRIRYTDPKLIAVSDKTIRLPSVDLEVTLTEEDLKFIHSVGAVLKCPHVALESVDGNVCISAADVKGEIVDNSSLSLDKPTKDSFRLTIKVDNLKLMPGSYDVQLSSKGISNFKHKTLPVSYFIAVESALSTFTAGAK